MNTTKTLLNQTTMMLETLCHLQSVEMEFNEEIARGKSMFLCLLVAVENDLFRTRRRYRPLSNSERYIVHFAPLEVLTEWLDDLTIKQRQHILSDIDRCDYQSIR